ncbi:MAG: nucleotidyltransferase family protein [Planctomycetota bacterium]|nr:MAG: nucleotidyltransferase family protein [Planctomycetota bacterium]
MINAVILAAGESKRMGKPKPLLKFNDKTFLEQIISVLKSSDIDTITVVLGAHAETIRQSIDLSETNVVINNNYKKGQLSSLIAALQNIPDDTEAILLCLVDHPFITKDLINSIVAGFKKTASPIIVPVFNKQRGHPTLFAKSLFHELLNAPEDQGARYVLYSNEDKVTELETTEPAARISIDTPADYKSHFAQDP